MKGTFLKPANTIGPVPFRICRAVYPLVVYPYIRGRSVQGSRSDLLSAEVC